ncbi:MULTISPECIES: urease accessory protein UreD [Methylomonas]|uniref:Urease accessory protein UreD n=2 Tax=Methylomonas TaxID=416 RepID=A0A126T7Q3_9GAMM|nr:MULTISPECIES: urease accessory protein UreD [Methylomonas]AMK78119.1 urease accessory protein UreD [Methylomonas denitrificans]OAH96483.1 urease accessory protein UreD [Methylomonas methanica]TCV85655.1 urease accessory protein [Methylomonas methanica]
MRPDFASLSNPDPITDLSAWEAELNLGFAQRGDKTVLARREHRGPLTVQRPFYPEGGVCHVYLLHPPGGIVAGDRLTIAATVEHDAQALITTPAAGKFYRSGGGEARQNVNLQIAENASLEWLPQETIVYEGARLNSSMNIDLADRAHFIGWEILALGRPAAGEGFDNGSANLNWRISRAGRLFYLERLRLDAEAFQARWGLFGHSACGTMLVYPATPLQLGAVQELIGDESNRGVTLIEGLLICRGLDRRADLLKSFFEAVWGLVRGDVIGKEVCLPRIWAT